MLYRVLLVCESGLGIQSALFAALRHLAMARHPYSIRDPTRHQERYEHEADAWGPKGNFDHMRKLDSGVCLNTWNLNSWKRRFAIRYFLDWLYERATRNIKNTVSEVFYR